MISECSSISTPKLVGSYQASIYIKLYIKFVIDKFLILKLQKKRLFAKKLLEYGQMPSIGIQKGLQLMSLHLYSQKQNLSIKLMISLSIYIPICPLAIVNIDWFSTIIKIIRQQMKFQKIIGNLFKQDKLVKQIKQTNMLQNSLKTPFMQKSMQLYNDFLKRNLEQDLIKNLLKLFEEKGNTEKKLKMLTVWIQIFKQTKYDLSDILVNKKIKLFTKALNPKSDLQELNKNNVQEYILVQILIPLYNYFMKLSMNEDLYKHCLIGKIPEDEVFRRGTKIRFIWIFKIYNLIYLLVPILQSCVYVLKIFPDFKALLQIAHVFYKDALTMNSFVIQALEEGSEDNFMLMPYFDMLQFYESMTEQQKIIVKINQIYSGLLTHESMKPEKPRMLNIDEDTMGQIQTQAVRVRLISCTLKNPKKDHSRLVTQYEQELTKEKNRLLKTEGGDMDFNSNSNFQQFTVKYKFLDQ